MKFYKFSARYKAPVLVDVLIADGRSFLFTWTGIYGVQVGPWFIGAIRGETRPGEGYPRAVD